MRNVITQDFFRQVLSFFQKWMDTHISVDVTLTCFLRADMRFVQILHCRIFRPKLLHRQCHLISTVLVIKTQKWKWRNLHCWRNFYTATGSQWWQMDKSHKSPLPPALQLQRNNTILSWLGKQINIKHTFKILLPICEYMPYWLCTVQRGLEYPRLAFDLERPSTDLASCHLIPPI